MVFAGELGRQNAASQQKLRAIKQHPTEEITGWTANSATLFFKKPAWLFPRDRVSKTYQNLSVSIDLINFQRQILKCILRVQSPVEIIAD